MREDTIPPGPHRLDRDVRNPRPDFRYSRDWRKRHTWCAGTEFVVREERPLVDEATLAGLAPEVRAKLLAASAYTLVELADDPHPSRHRVGPGDVEQYAALRAALVPCAESHAQFMARLGCGDGFASWLVETGALDRARFEELWDRYQHGDDAEGAPSGTPFCVKCGVDVEPVEGESGCPRCGFDTVVGAR